MQQLWNTIGSLFGWWEFAFALVLIPGLIFLYSWNKQRINRAFQKMGDPSLVSRLIHTHLTTIRFIQIVLILITVFFIVIALMRPQGNERMGTVVQQGIEVVIAVDTSRSMHATDVPPSRMDQAKKICESIVDQLIGHRVGLVRFAADAKLVCPLTTDVDILQTYIDTIDLQPISQGTDFAAALSKSVELFSSNIAINKVIVVLSDGEDLEEKGLEKASELAESGYFGFTVGIGTEAGGPIPLRDADGNPLANQYKKDLEGNQIITKLAPETLQKIAQKMGGTYFHYDIQGIALAALLKDLDKIRKAEFETLHVKTDREDIYQWFLILAIVLFIFAIAVEDLGKYAMDFIRQRQSIKQSRV